MANLKIPAKNQKRLLILAGVVLVVIVILYFGVIRSPGEPLPPEIQPSDRGALPEVNASLLEGEALEGFKVWDSLPVRVGPTGKENPFSK